MGSERVGLVIAAGTIGAILIVHGCNQDCGSVAYGMHPNDVVKATVIGPYDVGDAGASASSELAPCTGFADFVPGTEVIWTADFMPFGEGCDCTETLRGLTLNDLNGQPVMQQGLSAFVDAGMGCVGRLSVAIAAPNQDVSIFAPFPDAGPVPWVLVRTFNPMTDAGACPIGPAGCSDSFVARCTKQ